MRPEGWDACPAAAPPTVGTAIATVCFAYATVEGAGRTPGLPWVRGDAGGCDHRFCPDGVTPYPSGSRAATGPGG